MSYKTRQYLNGSDIPFPEIRAAEWQGDWASLIRYVARKFSGFVPGGESEVYFLRFTLGELSYLKVGYAERTTRRIKQHEDCAFPGVIVSLVGTIRFSAKHCAEQAETAIVWACRERVVKGEFLSDPPQNDREIQRAISQIQCEVEIGCQSSRSISRSRRL